jgi:hypothetical protein
MTQNYDEGSTTLLSNFGPFLYFRITKLAIANSISASAQVRESVTLALEPYETFRADTIEGRVAT